MSAPDSATPLRIVVRTFQPGDEPAFKRLNEQWISRYFRLEEKDIETLDNPRASILAGGGEIFMAVAETDAVGCCALVRSHEPDTFELVKMAVDERYQGRGVGRAVIDAAMAWARSRRARKLWLETNHVLTPAIRLYESSGFRHVAPTARVRSEYARSDVQMELRLDAT